MTCFNCNYSGNDFTRRGFEGSKQVWVCPDCGVRSVRHLVATEEMAPITEIDSFCDDSLDDIEESIKIRKYQDIASFEKRKANEVVRKLNGVHSVISEIYEVVSKYSYVNESNHSVGLDKSDEIGIIQLSDMHFNEIISLEHNKYDLNIASKRLQKLADEAKKYFDAKDIKKVVVIISGDGINSNRRFDEIMSASTNRSVATVIAADILSKFFADISSKYFVDVHYVVGNESRVGEELAFSNTSAYDNYDYLLMQLVKARFEGNSSITFFEPIDPNETVINCNGFNILALHGFNIKQNSMDANIQQLIGKYASQGILIDYVVCGHYHSPRISATYARCASLCGANAYSDMYLGLCSRACQNIYFLNTKSKSICGMVIDLQCSDKYRGYKFDKMIEKYNPKNAQL